MKYRVYPRLRTRTFGDGFIVGCPQSNIFVNPTTMDLIKQVDELSPEELESRYSGKVDQSVTQFLEHLHYLGFLVRED